MYSTKQDNKIAVSRGTKNLKNKWGQPVGFELDTFSCDWFVNASLNDKTIAVSKGVNKLKNKWGPSAGSNPGTSSWPVPEREFLTNKHAVLGQFQ